MPGQNLELNRQSKVTYVAALGLLLLTGVLFTVTSWNRAIERHERQLETLAIMGAHGLDTYFVTLEKSLSILAARINEQGGGSASRLLLEDFKRRYPEFQLVGVVSTSGDVLITSEPARPGPAPNQAKEPSFIEARELLSKSERMVVSRPLVGPVSKTWTTLLRVGVRDASGKLLFLVGGGLPLARTIDFWQGLALPERAAMGIMRDDFYMVARHPAPLRQSEAIIYTQPNKGLLADYLIRNSFPKSGLARGTGGFSGEQVVVAMQRLKNFPLTFYAVDHASNMRREWWASAWPTYVLLLLLFTGGVSIVRWVGKHESARAAEQQARMVQLEAMAQQLKASNDELADANAELDAFTYTVSHDLRSPLRAIDGFSALIKEDLGVAASPETSQLIAKVREAVVKMQALLNSLFDLSRYSKEPLQLETVDMNAVVASVLDDLASADTVNTSRAKFEIATLPSCRADRVLIRQVWQNLISNAVKYSANASAPLIRIGFAEGAYFIEDNGVGFDMRYAEKLFKVFSRLHGVNEFSGNGVGLAIIKRIVERHGGRIRAEGKEGAGARFWFTIKAFG